MRANKSNYIISKVHFIERLNTLGFKRKDMNEFTAKMNGKTSWKYTENIPSRS